MTIILPESDNTVSGRPPAQPDSGAFPAGINVRDFGESLVQPIDPVRLAAEFCLVDCSLHDATRTFDAFTHELTTADSDFDSWPQRFTAEAKRVRDLFAHRIPDGPSRDRFDAGFDVFAKAKAVETRGLATHKRIATNRAELDRALSGYSESISQAMNPVSADFALAQGEAAIRNQVAAQVLSEDEGEALSRRYRADIASRRAHQFTDDDPAAAAAELKKATGGLFADLDPAARRALIGHAERLAAARQQDVARAQNSKEQHQDAQSTLRREVFLRDLDERTRNGAASLADIAAAARDGILDPDEADTRMRALESDLAGRARSVRHVADLITRPGVFLKPDDAEDRRAAEIHWKDLVEPLATDLPPGERAIIEDSVVTGTGIVPRPLADELRGGLLSGEPEKRVAAARRVHRWLLRQPPIPIDKNGLRIPELESLRPYLDLPISPRRMTELADRDMDREGESSGAAKSGPDAGGDDRAQPTPLGEAQDRLDEKLADPDTRAALREQLLKDLDAEAERSGLSPAQVLARQQEIREALPADPAKGTQVALAPVIAAGAAGAGGASGIASAIAPALAVIGLGGLLKGDTQGDDNTTENSIVERAEDDDGRGKQGGNRSSEESSSGDTPAGDSSDGLSERKRPGRKAKDSSKNERHGDEGRTARELAKKLEEEKAIEAARKLPRKERIKEMQKIKNRQRIAAGKKRGTEHSRRGKGQR